MSCSIEQSPNKHFSRVLVIEDSDIKWSEVVKLLRGEANFNVDITRAATVVDGETEVSTGDWDLIILDVSMDITSSSVGAKRGGHDALGGLRIANKMFLLGNEAPTVILTAFDAFPAGEMRRGSAEILGLEDVESRASDLLGEAFLGCVRYSELNWEAAFLAVVSKALTK